MKLTNKLFALLMSLSIVVGIFTINVLAAENGKIIINNTSTSISMKGHKYTAYKIFDVIYDESKTNYDYSIATEFVTFFKSKGCVTNAQAYDYIKTLSDDSLMQAFARDAYNGKGTAEGKSSTATLKNTVTIENLENGYYLVYDEGNNGAINNEEKAVAAAILTTTKPDAIVNLKADVPTLDKKIVNVTKTPSNTAGIFIKDAVDAEIGEHVQFKLSSKVPDLTGYTSYTYTINDTLSEGFIADNNIKVLIGNVDKTTNCILSSNGQKFMIKVPLETLKTSSKGKEIIVTYSAKLNKKAVIYPNGSNINKANLEYSNNPNKTESSDVTPDIIVRVYTFTIEITKQNDKEEFLSGAEFTLKDANGNYIAVKKDELSNRYIVDRDNLGDIINSVVVSDINGKIYVDGLKSDVYKLTETKAPKGYNKLVDDVTITIVAKYNEDLTLATNLTGNTAVVINKSGYILPGTGGIGTVIFYKVGVGIMIAAVFIMIFKRRRTK